VAADAVTLPKLGIKYFDEITDISRVTANQLVSYSKQFEKLYRSGKIGALTEDQAALLVKLAKELDVEVRIDEGHPGTFWHIMRRRDTINKTIYLHFVEGGIKRLAMNAVLCTSCTN
jgi:hypothetical protein